MKRIIFIILFFLLERNNILDKKVCDTLELDIIDGCNAKCVCCPRGLGLMGNSMKKMDIELYKRIIKKAKQIHIQKVVLFSWSEPLLHPNLVEFLKIAKDNNMTTFLSTNLSLKNIDLEHILQYTDEMIISVSGFHQSTYKINHKNCDVELVKQNINKIKNLNIKTHIQLRYFVYDYNQSEIELWKNFLPSNIQLWKCEGNDNPLQSIEAIQKHVLPDEYFGKIEYGKNKYRDNIRLDYCNLLRMIVLDWNVDEYLCCEKMYDNSIKIGNFLTDNIYELQRKKFLHKECDICHRKKSYLNFLHKQDLMQIERREFL